MCYEGFSLLVLLLCFGRNLVCRTFSSLDLESNQLGYESKGLGQKRDNTCCCLAAFQGMCYVFLHCIFLRQGGLIEFSSGQWGMREAKTFFYYLMKRVPKPTD